MLVEAIRGCNLRSVAFNGGRLGIADAVHILLSVLEALHSLWSQRAPYVQEDVDRYTMLCQRFGQVWAALQWKVSTWVHWMVRHSARLAAAHRNFLQFSSVPVERRHSSFKADCRHAFYGWRLSRQRACHAGLVRVMRNLSVDAGLARLDASIAAHDGASSSNAI